MIKKWVTLALIAAPALASGQQPPTKNSQDNRGMNNTQTINQPAGDASVAHQTAHPGSSFNTQNVTISTPHGRSPNTALQSVGGSANNQSIVMDGGSGNVAVQSTGGHSARNTQFATIAGSGNHVVQSQHGAGNHQSANQTGRGNIAVQTQRGNNLTGALRQRGGQTDVQNQNPE